MNQNERNRLLAEEFRANGGRVKDFADGTVLLLTTTGKKTGRIYVTPLRYSVDGDRYVILASHQGAPTSPDWYHNLVANPEVTVEVGDEKFAARGSTVTDAAERQRLYDAHATIMSQFAEYQTRTTRVIPVVVLERN